MQKEEEEEEKQEEQEQEHERGICNLNVFHVVSQQREREVRKLALSRPACHERTAVMSGSAAHTWLPGTH